ncbi:amidohydrolase family protein [Lunatimonas lonarensis]|uniref:amidohydrolase family protein n=1 Tax=Lunatimonas lonarensis TaxID=1232681 RepID=UPI0004ADF3BA|nr:amidohydrolase family protein [Lunatimonas lonarensis]
MLFSWLFGSCDQRSANYKLDEYSQVKKFDVHVHLETERNLFVDLAKVQNFRLVNISLEYTQGWDDVYGKFSYGLKQHQAAPAWVEMVTAFAVSDWDDPAWESKTLAWLDSCFDAGAVGVKVWKNIGMVSRDTAGNLIQIDDPKFDPIFSHIQNRDKVLMGHLAEPKNCWLPLEEMTTNNDRRYYGRHPEYHMYLQPDMPSHEELIGRRDRVLEKNPDLKFVGAHLGSLEYDVDELAKRLDRFPNMTVDLAARMGQVFYQTAKNREKVRTFFIQYQDRILYGTDLADDGERTREQLNQAMEENWKRDWEFFVTANTMESSLIDTPFQGLDLPREVVDKVFYQNAVRWFGLID